MTNDLTLSQKQELIALQERKLKLIEGLPFLHGYKHYTWSRGFYSSTNKISLLCAGNQCGKSVAQIRKCINWATDQSLWKELWDHKPQQFWYMYPSVRQVNSEFLTKWQTLLPSGEFKNDPIYGWRAFKQGPTIDRIQFNNGVQLFFRTYTQNIQHLQTSSVDAVFADEELPIPVYDEIIFRISATNGYFNMVFTATLGQEFWRDCMEERGKEREKLKEASKWQVSMYDCLTFEDGTRSHWTEERIGAIKNRCKNNNEVLKRVYGRFVLDQGGRKYEQFDLRRHVIPPRPIPEDWLIYAGVDPGSGGQNHPGAIIFVAVRPDFRFAEVFDGWRGDYVQTTSSDILQKFIDMRGDRQVMGQYYDFADRDFFTMAVGIGEPFQPADKSHTAGEHIINVMFKNDMLFVHDTPELEKLGRELTFLNLATLKRSAADDLTDALRYALTRVPWDWSGIKGNPISYKPLEKPPVLTDIEIQLLDRKKFSHIDEETKNQILQEQEFEEINEMYGE